MKILFAGSHVPNEVEISEPGISAAGNRFQNNFIEHLRSAGHDVKEISYIGVRVNDPEPLADTGRYILGSKKRGFGPFSRIFNAFCKISGVIKFNRLMKRSLSGRDAVISYNVVYAWLKLPKLAKKAGVKSIVILADYSPKESFDNPIKSFFAGITKKTMQRYDVVVGLSEGIRDYLLPGQEFILMEGGIDESFYDRFSGNEDIHNDNIINIMYSGLLSNVTGVDILLDAIKNLKGMDNLHFTFTGKGDLSGAVKEASEHDKRIDYKGSLSYEEYIDALKTADILINPRNMDLPENRNNFPSKIMDYLATGKPVISTKFAGYEKFSKHILFTDDITETLRSVGKGNISPDAGNNREFAKQFLWKEQIGRIIG